MLAGNGGSAADSQHIAAEFMGRLNFDRDPLPAIALTANTSNLTCIANDYGYDHIFSRQALALANENDALIVYSTSGKSKNILNLSRSEGSPKALIEGIACGCFPIVSAIEAHIDLLDDLKYGEIINYPKNNKEKVGNFNRKYLDEFNYKYSIEKCVQRESEFMKKILMD